MNAKVLVLGRNEFATLPDEIGKLRNLTHLDVMDCMLTSIPASIGMLVNLTVLNLSRNATTRATFVASMSTKSIASIHLFNILHLLWTSSYIV